jgi:hypothetical protein
MCSRHAATVIVLASLTNIMPAPVSVVYLQGDFQGYCDRMEQRGVWGGEPELVVACNVVRR